MESINGIKLGVKIVIKGGGIKREPGKIVFGLIVKRRQNGRMVGNNKNGGCINMEGLSGSGDIEIGWC